MSYYQEIRSSRPKARKPYRCDWCNELIGKGEIHAHEVGVFDGDFQNHRFHPECLSACNDYCGEGDSFEPGSYARPKPESLNTSGTVQSGVNTKEEQ